MTIFEFAYRVQTEEKAIAYAKELGILNDQDPTCIRCGRAMKLESRGNTTTLKQRRRCFKRNCRYSFSMKGQFSKSNKPISTILKLMYFFSLNWKVSEAAIHCDASKKTCVRWYKIFRRIIHASILNNESVKIGGTGCTVEVDETYLCKRKYNVGRVLISQSVWVVGGICRENGKIFLRTVTRRNAENLTAILNECVEPGTTVITDCWRGYNRLTDNGFHHLTVNHKLNFVDPVNRDIHTQRIERLWKSVKSYIPKNVRRQYIQQHLSKFIDFQNSNYGYNLSMFNNFVYLFKIYFS